MYKYTKGHGHWRAERRQKVRTKKNLGRQGKAYNPLKVVTYKRTIGLDLFNAPASRNGLFSSSSHADLCIWLDGIEKHAQDNNIVIKFSKDSRLMAHIAVLLYAKLEQILRKVPKRKFFLNLSNANYLVKKMIYKSGIADLVGHPVASSGFENIIQIVSGDCSHENIQAWEGVVDKIIELENFDAEQESRIGSSLSETVTNVNYHAYPKEGIVSEKKWWLYFEITDEQLYLVIYDAGVGIPKTLQHQEWFREMAKERPSLMKSVILAISRAEDASVIKASMIQGTTRLKKKKHGLGSESILELVDSNSNGTLWICSNHGIYEKSSKSRPKLRNSKESIHGTLVQWNIRLSDE